jgi:HD-GYP domain-containing protein (c-di-GMP phosphodiesterase class II)
VVALRDDTKRLSRQKHYSLEAVFFMASEDLTAADHDADRHVAAARYYAVETTRGMLGRRIGRRIVSAASRAALLHDFGKMFVDEKILRKRGPLTPRERRAIERHPLLAHEIFSRTPLELEAQEGILYHHERYDGRGYPKGLRGERIPLIARMVAVVDAYEAMTHDRPYKKAISRLAAIEELKRSAGMDFDATMTERQVSEMQFDPKAIKAFLKAHKKRHPAIYK